MIGKRLRLTLPSQPQSLNAIRRQVNELIEGTVYEDRSADILIVVSEACANVVRHAYEKDFKNPVIDLEVNLEPDVLKIMVGDKGKGLTMRSCRISGSEEGGFGLYLMQKLSDSFECNPAPGGGTVIELGFVNPHANGQKVQRVATPRGLRQALQDLVSGFRAAFQQASQPNKKARITGH